MDITLILLILCLGVVLAFEFVNGMNDTANAIAPVIYSHSLEPKKSVFIAAFLNFLWVLLGGTAVAMSIMHLLPLSAIANSSTAFGITLVVAILISAIIWDLGAWWLALPVSSSHALIGSILGVSIFLTLMPTGTSVTPNWGKAWEVIEWLLISPLIGFSLALGAIYLAHIFLRKKQYFKSPFWSWDKPTLGMRTTLIISSCLVSFMHGKNDGQKWVGIATLILITLLPASFAINPHVDSASFGNNLQTIGNTIEKMDISYLSGREKVAVTSTKKTVEELLHLTKKSSWNTDEKVRIRQWVLQIQDDYKLLSSANIALVPGAHADGSTPEIESIKDNVKNLSIATDYIPWWIIAIVSISIGSGTLIGWKRIVRTIGEKIGKHKMTYAQAASSALVTAGTIGLASHFGLPVSTTHVMSSSVAGTMVEEHGWKDGVDPHMIKHILLAWVLTMPVTIILAGSIFWILRSIFL